MQGQGELFANRAEEAEAMEKVLRYAKRIYEKSGIEEMKDAINFDLSQKESAYNRKNGQKFFAEMRDMVENVIMKDGRLNDNSITRGFNFEEFLRASRGQDNITGEIVAKTGPSKLPVYKTVEANTYGIGIDGRDIVLKYPIKVLRIEHSHEVFLPQISQINCIRLIEKGVLALGTQKGNLIFSDLDSNSTSEPKIYSLFDPITCIEPIEDLPTGGKRLALGTHNSLIIFWTDFKSSNSYKLLGHTEEITSIISLRKSTVLSASKDGNIAIWSITGRPSPPLAIFKAHHFGVNDIVLTDHDKTLVSAGEDRTIGLKDISEVGKIKDLGHIEDTGPVRAVRSLNKNSHFVLSFGSDTELKIWNTLTKRYPTTFI